MHKKKLRKDISYFSSSKVLSLALLTLREFILAKFLAPSYYGIWHSCKILIGYGRYFSLGMPWSMQKEIASFLNKKSHQEIDCVKNITFSSVLMSTILFSAIFFPLSSIFLYKKIESLPTLTLSLLFLLVFLQQINNYFLMLLASYQNFSLKSKLLIFESLLNVVLLILFIHHFKIYGIIWSLIVSYATSSLIIAIKMKFTFTFLISSQKTFILVKEGLMMLLNGILLNIMTTIDRLFVIVFLGKIQMGYYSIAYSIGMLISMIPAAIGEVLFPSMAKKYRSENNVLSIKSYVLKPRVFFAYFSPFVIAIAYFFLPVLIHYFLPHYSDGLNAIKITLLFSFFTVILSGLVYFFFSLGEVHVVLYLRIAIISLEALLISIFLKMNFGIEGAAYGKGIGLLCFSLTIILLSLRYFKISTKEILLFIIELCFPFLYTLFLIVVLNNIFKEITNNIYRDTIFVLVKIFFLAIFSIPLFYYLDKKINFLSEIKSLLKK